MADILVHNAIKDVQQAINEGTTNIIYKPILGSELYDYVKAIIDANKTTGPYNTGGGGSATQPISDLSCSEKISLCTCSFSGSGTSCTSPCMGGQGVWRDGTVLPGNPGGSTQTPAQLRAAILSKETSVNGIKLLESMYGADNTNVQNDIILVYWRLLKFYTDAADTQVLQFWYGVGGSFPQGSRISNSNYLKVCGGSWRSGEGATCTWTVPAGATCARFQVWGAGMGSNPGCCCGGSNGGSHGAYAEMTIKVTPGDQYVMCAGCACSIMCCSNVTPGYGCMSGVTGNGICCLKADGEFCYNGNCYNLSCTRVKSGHAGASCWYWGSTYCTNSGHCWCSYSEYCAVGCSTCGVVEIYPNCWTDGGGQFCNCATTACVITDGGCYGHRGLYGGGCTDTNHYGYHVRAPVIDADTGLMFADNQGCFCFYFTSGTCCGGTLATGWTKHPGMGGTATHVMGGANQFYGEYGTGGMVQVSWVTS